MPNTTPSTTRQPYVHRFLWEGFVVQYTYLDAFEAAYGSLAGKYLLRLVRPERIAIKTIASILDEEF